MKNSRLFIVSMLLAIAVIIISFQQCSTPSADAAVSPYLNMHDSVQYVGMQTCRSCHADIYNTYIQTGMGRSFDMATPQKSDAFFNHHALVYDTANNFYYKPYFKNDSLFIKEYRLAGKDTVHQRIEHVSYIIGSGNHTNSHLVNFNGFVYQTPITFYTQKQQWDMAPGFEKGYNSRFDRIIAYECMTCHNGLPDFVSGSENLYQKVPNGIDCERCHGKGSLHVKEKLAGNIIDTSKQPDYTIVNPKRLSKSLQMSLCQRCHLQGVSVLAEGKDFDDFKPGMELNAVCNVFLPVFESKQNNFLMASQAERLRLSACYLKSDMTCITCHNPHVSVKQTPKKIFNSKCESCHQTAQQTKCNLALTERNKNGNDCSGCHMPKSASVDIPHVSIHDHYIRKNNLQTGNQLALEDIEKIQQFVQLKCYTTEKPDALLKAKGFIAFYEKFSSKRVYLDSALLYLNAVQQQDVKFNTLVHFYFLEKNYQAIIKAIETYNINKVNDSWTCYRIGEAYYAFQNYTKALVYFEKAIKIAPYNLDFLNKTASSYFNAGNNSKALNYYNKIIQLQPKYITALSNAGYLYMLQNDAVKSIQYFKEAIRLDPDYEQALLNLAQWHYWQQEPKESKKNLQSIVSKNPNNEQAKKLLEKLN